MNPITPERLDAIEARVAAIAKEGPEWVLLQDLRPEYRWNYVIGLVGSNREIGNVLFQCYHGFADKEFAPNVGSFIAHSRADVPDLAAEVRRCWAELGTAAKVLEECETALRANASAWDAPASERAQRCRTHAENARKMAGAIRHALAKREGKA